MPVGLATAAVGLYSDNNRKQGGKIYIAPWIDAGKNAYRGESIVIFGGSSSVGQFGKGFTATFYMISSIILSREGIQLAKLSGFSPIVTTASLHNSDLLKSLGANYVVDRSASDVPAEIRKALGSSTAPLVYDTISVQETQTQAWNLLAPGGSLILSQPSLLDITEEGESRHLVGIIGNFHVPYNRSLGESLYAKLTSLLENESIKVRTFLLVSVLFSGALWPHFEKMGADLINLTFLIG